MTRGLKIFITISVLLNIMFLGIGSGMLGKIMYEEAQRDFQKNLLPETRQLMSQTFQQSFKDMESIGQRARDAREKLIGTMTAENFIESDFDGALSELRSSQQDIMSIKIAATKELMQNLPQEEREKIAGRLASIFDVKRHRHKGKKGFWNERKKDMTGRSPVDDEIDRMKAVFGPFRPEDLK